MEASSSGVNVSRSREPSWPQRHHLTERCIQGLSKASCAASVRMTGPSVRDATWSKAFDAFAARKTVSFCSHLHAKLRHASLAAAPWISRQRACRAFCDASITQRGTCVPPPFSKKAHLLSSSKKANLRLACNAIAVETEGGLSETASKSLDAARNRLQASAGPRAVLNAVSHGFCASTQTHVSDGASRTQKANREVTTPWWNASTGP
mmetsp:Transcript_25901/g.72740  ORF Transcript_25901/g.72740 Transcript_25901/m.72740 type:complete len:208 (-) Transcript_25901:1111-1734(-)